MYFELNEREREREKAILMGNENGCEEINLSWSIDLEAQSRNILPANNNFFEIENIIVGF